MLRWIILAVALAFGPPAAAQDRQAIEEVITRQLDAFTDRDVDEAWGYASPMIQGMFGTPGNFATMVENGYPMVWNNADRAFQELEGDGPQARQKVFVRDPEGRGWILLYSMISTESGWKINGVQVLPAPELAA